MSIFDGLITSKMRVRILMRLFLNSQQQVYTRALAEEFKAPVSQVSDELKQLQAAGLLQATRNGRRIFFRANSGHPLYPELHSMVLKSLGMDSIVESVITRLGNLECAFLVDDYAEGKDSGLVDLVLVGDIDRRNLDDLVQKAERYVKRKIRTLVISRQEYQNLERTFKYRPRLLLWETGKSGGGTGAGSAHGGNGRSGVTGTGRQA